MGMKIGRPSVVMIPDGRPATYIRAIEQNMSDHVQLVCCIVPSNKKDCYDAIKKLCCISRPVPSQVIVSRTLSKPKTIMSVATKIGIQLNCKLGGEVWGVEMPLKGLMVVGIDCYHDSGSKGRSVGGVIASMNQNLTQYYSRCTFQHNHGELMNQLKVCMTGALKEFHRSVVILCDSMAAFTLTVRGKENYDLLCAMRDQLELASDLLREKNQASL